MKSIRGFLPSPWASSPSPSSWAWAGGGSANNSGSVVATVGDLSISSDEFKRAYENTYRFYKEKVPGEFKDETIKQYVVEQLVDQPGVAHRGPEHGSHRSPTKIYATSIMQIPEFQRNGTFDPEHYQRLLAANHLTPSMFEGDAGEGTAQHQEPG